MFRSRRRAWATMSLLLGSVAVALAQGAAALIIVTRPEQMKFNPGLPAGSIDLSSVMLSGPLDKPVPYVLRVRLGPGGQVSPHTHPDTRYVTVLSGEYSVGRGETMDRANETVLPPGSFFVVPAGVPHYSVARNGETVYQEYGVGPTATNFIKK